MKRTLIFTPVLLLLLFPSGLSAQDQPLSLLLFGNMSVPLGAFGENIGSGAEVTRRFGFYIGEDAGLAKIGFGAGAELSNTLLGSDFAWVVSAKFLSNPTDNSELTAFFTKDFKDTLSVQFETGSWISIPVLTGFTYTFGVGEGVNLYGSLQAGLIITRQASRKAIVSGSVVEESTFNFLAGFGYEFGVGLEFGGGYNISARYLDVGSPYYGGTRVLNEEFFTTIPKREISIDGDQRSVGMILFMLGYRI